jgi:FtsH-binding integral membrane protein
MENQKISSTNSFSMKETQKKFEERSVFSYLFDFGKLSENVKIHLSIVYALLSFTFLSSVFGCIFGLYLEFDHPRISSVFILFLGDYVYESRSPGTPIMKQKIRLGLLGLFGFIKGMSIAPLIALAIEMNPSIVINTLLYTVLVFASFSIASFYTTRRDMILLGGFLGGFLSILFISSLVNLFFGSIFLFNLNLYGGLILFSFYVVYDTQKIIAKVKDFGLELADPISDSLDLFVDFVAIFIRILIILMKNNKKNDRK